MSLEVAEAAAAAARLRIASTLGTHNFTFETFALTIVVHLINVILFDTRQINEDSSPGHGFQRNTMSIELCKY